jgi:DNA-binding transcriptional LysR family regulator
MQGNGFWRLGFHRRAKLQLAMVGSDQVQQVEANVLGRRGEMAPAFQGKLAPKRVDDLDAEVLYWDRSFMLCGNNHRLARRRKIGLAELVDEQWLLPRESVFSSYLTWAFEASGSRLA